MILKLGSITVAPVVTLQPSGYSLQTKSVTPTLSLQTVSADAGYYGLQTVTVSAVTSSIDSNIQASYIKSGISILGVTGTYTGVTPTTTALTISPSTASSTYTPTAGTYYSQVTANAVTAAIDSNIVASNIMSGVTILGVAGNVVFQTYYSGSSAPSSSLGVEGDIYLQV